MITGVPPTCLGKTWYGGVWRGRRRHIARSKGSKPYMREFPMCNIGRSSRLVLHIGSRLNRRREKPCQAQRCRLRTNGVLQQETTHRNMRELESWSLIILITIREDPPLIADSLLRGSGLKQTITKLMRGPLGHCPIYCRRRLALPLSSLPALPTLVWKSSYSSRQDVGLFVFQALPCCCG